MNLSEKYRPKTFDEVVGQDKAIQRIKRVLSQGWGGLGGFELILST